MKKSKLLATSLLASALMMAGCNPGGSDDPSGENTDTCQHVDVNHDHKCDLCEETVSEHDWQWQTVTAATFEQAGSEKQVCSVCGEDNPAVQPRPISVLTHHYSEEWSPKDSEHHWHACTDEGYGQLGKDDAEHNFGDLIPDTPATFEHGGFGHKVCADCGYVEENIVIPQLQHHYSEEWSPKDSEYHWHACTDVGYEELGKDATPHSDLNADFICDDCEAQLNGVESVSIITPVTYMGRGEIVEISANVVKHGSSTGAVVFSIPSDSSFSLLNNEDGTAFLSLEESTSTSEISVVVTCASVEDPSISTTQKIFASTYGSSKRTQIQNFFGVDDYHFIPYFIGTTFTSSSGVFNQASINNNGHATFEKVLGAFKNQGTWTVVSEEADSAILTISNPNDQHSYFKASMSRNGTGTNVVYTKELVEHNSFPSEAVGSFVSGHTESAVVSPDDGSVFTFTKTSSKATITSNGSLDSYKAKLEAANYYTIVNGLVTYCVSPERTLEVTLKSTTDGFEMSFMTKTAPTQTAWPTADANKMVALVGEAIPFIPNDYGTWYSEDNCVYSYADCDEAELIAINVMDNATGFTKDTTQDLPTYVKPIDNLSDCVVIIEGSSLFVYKNPKVVSTWEGTAVENALGVSSGSIIEPSGTEYMYQFSEGEAIVKVTGLDIGAYKTSLESNNYLVWTKTSGLMSTTDYAISQDRSILVKLTSDTLTFTKQADLKKEDWSEADKTLMTQYMGSVLPFVREDYGDWNYYEVDNYIYAQSYRIEAQVVAKEVFDNDGSFGEAVLSSGSYIYTKSFDKYSNLVVTLLSNGQIKINKENVYLSTWEESDITTALGSEAKDALPSAAASGNTFQYTFGDNSVTIGVMNDTASTIMDYQDALVAASFVGDVTASGGTFKSPTDTLTVEVKKVSSKKFTITATGHLPEGQYHELPTSLIAKQLNNDAGLADLALPDGSLFFYEAKDKYECDITVLEGGSMSTFTGALETKGFVLNDAAYEKEGNNIRIVVTAEEDGVYSAHLSLIEKPTAAEWPEDCASKIEYLCSYNEFTQHSTLPCPQDATSIYLDSGDVTVEGASVEAYVAELEQEGFRLTYSSYYECYYIYDNADGWYAFYLYVLGPTSFYFSSY